MKRTDLVKRWHRLADQYGAEFELVREGGGHTVYRVNGRNIVVGRHSEIKERTAQGILDDVETAAKGKR